MTSGCPFNLQRCPLRKSQTVLEQTRQETQALQHRITTAIARLDAAGRLAEDKAADGVKTAHSARLHSARIARDSLGAGIVEARPRPSQDRGRHGLRPGDRFAQDRRPKRWCQQSALPEWRRATATLAPGKAALFVLLRVSASDMVIARPGESGGKILRTDLDPAAEDRLRATFALAHAEAAKVKTANPVPTSEPAV